MMNALWCYFRRHYYRWLFALTALIAPSANAAQGGLKLISITTLVGEMLTFAVLVWVMMKYVWPPLTQAIEKRQKEIADGLAASEQGKAELIDAKAKKTALLEEARQKSTDMMAIAEKRRESLIESAKQEAEQEKARILEQGRREVEVDRLSMQKEVKDRLGDLVMLATTKVLQREVDASAHQDMIESVKKDF